MRIILLLLALSIIACQPVAKKVSGKYVSKIEQEVVTFDDGMKMNLPSGEGTKVIYLIRHAEKDTVPAKNPILTDQGYERSYALAQIFKSTRLDAVYSTLYNRTMHTVDSLTNMKGISTKIYQPKELKSLSAELLESTDLNRVLIAGHSNTTPALAGVLMGEQQFTEGFDESDYTNLLIFTVDKEGKKELHQLRYFAVKNEK